MDDHQMIHDIRSKIGTIEVSMTNFEKFMETIVGELRSRIKGLEDFRHETVNSIHTSCDTMHQTVDTKISKAMSKVYAMVTALFALFIGAVVYFNEANSRIYESMRSSHSKIYDRVAENNKPTIENTTNIKIMLTTLNKIDAKLDAITEKAETKHGK